MKQTISLILIAMALTSCDNIRSILGMATSKDIEKAKLELQKEELLRKQKADSIAFVRDSIRNLSIVNEKDYTLQGRFFVIAGSFKEPNNALDMSNTLKEAGFNPITLDFKNGFKLVGIGGFDNYNDAYREYKKLENTDFSSYDIWIYDVKQNLHLD